MAVLNLLLGILDLILGKLIGAFFLMMGALFVFLVFAMPKGNIIIYKNGIYTAPKLIMKMRGTPEFVPFRDIKGISPVYQWMNGILKIVNFKFHYGERKSFQLPPKGIPFKVQEQQQYVNALMVNCRDFWRSKYSEDYEIENPEWARIEKTMKVSEGKIIGLTAVIAVIAGIIPAGILFSRAGNEMSLSVVLFFLAVVLGVMQVALAIGKMSLKRTMNYFFVLKKLSIKKGDGALAQDIRSLPRFQRLNKKLHIDYIESLEDYRFPGRIKHMSRKGMEKSMKTLKTRFIVIGIVVAVMFVSIAGMVFVMMFNMTGGGTSSNDYIKDEIPGSGQFTLSNSTIMNDRILDLTGNLVVMRGGTVHLQNLTVVWNLSVPGGAGLYVEEGGYLYAENCTFNGYDNDTTYKCELHGRAELYNCTFNNLWGDREVVIGQGGIEAYHDDIILENCKIFNAYVSGIIIGECSATVRNSTINGCFDDGMEIFGGSPVIDNNLIESNDDGIMIFDSEARISNNSVRYNRGRGVAMFGDRKPVLENNHILNNEGGNIVDDNDDIFLFIMLFFPLLLIFILIPVMIFSYRSAKKRLLEGNL